MKSEPHVFSIDDLERQKRTPWEGVRNYQARNFMRDSMALRDWVLFYHSSATPSGVAGLAEVASRPYPDPTQFDESSEYFDARATESRPRWYLVDVAFLERFPRLVSLAELKADAALSEMLVVRAGMRLSVQPVERRHCARVLAAAGAKHRLR